MTYTTYKTTFSSTYEWTWKIKLLFYKAHITAQDGRERTASLPYDLQANLKVHGFNNLDILLGLLVYHNAIVWDGNNKMLIYKLSTYLRFCREKVAGF